MMSFDNNISPEEMARRIKGIAEHPAFREIGPGTPTQTVDVNGRVLCVGDFVQYNTGEDAGFEIVFEDNAFRKRYDEWEEGLERPVLETNRWLTACKVGLIWEASPWQRSET